MYETLLRKWLKIRLNNYHSSSSASSSFIAPESAYIHFISKLLRLATKKSANANTNEQQKCGYIESRRICPGFIVRCCLRSYSWKSFTKTRNIFWSYGQFTFDDESIMLTAFGFVCIHTVTKSYTHTHTHNSARWWNVIIIIRKQTPHTNLWTAFCSVYVITVIHIN